MTEVKYYLEDSHTGDLLANDFDSADEALDYANENDVNSFLILSIITSE